MNSPRILLFALVCTFFLSQCGPHIHIFKPKAYFEKGSPGTARMWSDYYCDQYEVSNAQWRHYTSWLGKMYGTASSQFKNALPDTTVWLENELSCSLSATVYHKHPAYDDDPVVGISQGQARKYASWRSDRYFESILVKNGIIKSFKARKNRVIFSTKAFFEGRFINRSKLKEWNKFPVFRLPKFAERQRIASIVDSVNTAYFNHGQLLKPDGCEQGYPNWNLGVQPDEYGNLLGRVTRPVFDDCVAPRPALFHFKGNVSEWLDEPKFAAGGGWIHDAEDLNQDLVTTAAEPNAWTGFRCILEWQEWPQ